MRKILLISFMLSWFFGSCTDEFQRPSRAVSGTYICNAAASDSKQQIDLEKDGYRLVISSGSDKDIISIKIFGKDDQLYFSTEEMNMKDNGQAYEIDQTMDVYSSIFGGNQRATVFGVIEHDRRVNITVYLIEKEIEFNFYQ